MNTNSEINMTYKELNERTTALDNCFIYFPNPFTSIIALKHSSCQKNITTPPLVLPQIEYCINLAKTQDN